MGERWRGEIEMEKGGKRWRKVRERAGNRAKRRHETQAQDREKDRAETKTKPDTDRTETDASREEKNKW